jgi:MarR family transcriptional regulator, transcriptional regulator for hemolysin
MDNSTMRTFGFLLKDVSRLSSKNFERHMAAAALGLTLEQCKVLIYLQSNQGINQKRLAYLTDTDQMTLVRILDRMEQDGWIERQPDPQDRRARRLRLKPAATTVLKQVWIIADRSRAEALAGLDEADREHLLALMGRIHGNLAALVPGAVEPDRACFPPEEAQDSAQSPTESPKRAIRARGKN